MGISIEKLSANIRYVPAKLSIKLSKICLQTKCTKRTSIRLHRSALKEKYSLVSSLQKSNCQLGLEFRVDLPLFTSSVPARAVCTASLSSLLVLYFTKMRRKPPSNSIMCQSLYSIRYSLCAALVSKQTFDIMPRKQPIIIH